MSTNPFTPNFSTPPFQPTSAKLEICPGRKVPDSYIVMFKDHILHDDMHLFARKHFTNNMLEDLRYIPSLPGQPQSFALPLDRSSLDLIRKQGEVALISENGIMSCQDIHQSDAPWGISRISRLGQVAGSNAMRCGFPYDYSDPPFASFVDVYVMDTGIQRHSEFDSRLRFLSLTLKDGEFTVVEKSSAEAGEEDLDKHGHGTHCAGIIAGTRFGVAKKVNLVSVKVLSDDGCAHSTLLDWLPRVGKHIVDKRAKLGLPIPSVVNLSLGSPKSTPINKAIEVLIQSGIHVVAAACNQNNDASYYSPAGVDSVITVGASTFNDTRAWFSNTGSLVDIYAPGVFIRSASCQVLDKEGFKPETSEVNASVIGMQVLTQDAFGIVPQETEFKSGTSMACAHVSGIVAYILGHTTPKMLISPEEIKEQLLMLSEEDALDDIPLESHNRLAKIGPM